MKTKISLIIVFLTNLIILQAQQRASGIVKDELGLSIVGASILEKGTSNGTITNLDGRFTLNLLSQKSKLIISYIGYTRKEVDATNNLIVNLNPSTKVIEEVVVIGYGTQRKETVVGAVTTVKGSELAKSTSSNLTNSLAGRVSGVTTIMGSGRPGKNVSEIYIRGISTLAGGDSSPLILVDGVERDMGQVDAEDIESFTVLKDAAATAVYGVRGANGVILVTTKRGTEGKVKINASIQQSYNELIRLPQVLNSFQFASLRNEALLNDGLPLEYTQNDLDLYRSHASPYTHPDNNYVSDFIRKITPKTQANINISGGTDKVKYFVSGNFLNEEGILKNFSKVNDLTRFDTFNSLSDDVKKTFSDVSYNPNPSYKRFNLRTNLDMQLSKTAKLEVDLTARLDKTRNIGIGNSSVNDFFWRLSRTAPNLFPYITPNGKFGAQGGDNQSPLVYLTSSGYTETNGNTIEGSMRYKQDLEFVTKGLSLDLNLSLDNIVNSGWNVNHRPEVGRYSRNGIYSQISAETDWSTAPAVKSTERQILTQYALRYERTFKNHKVGVLGLVKQRLLFEQATLPVNDLDYVARVTYNYKSKYLFETNMAYNGSTNFNVSNRYGFFPSLSLGWVVSEESIWKEKLSNFDLFKIRGSIGVVGNDKLGKMNYFYQNTYGNGDVYNFGDRYTFADKTGYYETQLGNDFVTWEQSIKSNIGFDLKFLGKFKLTTDFFYENRFDILAKRSTVPYVFGLNYSLPPENLAKVVNRGLEFELGYRERFGKFNFWVNANLTFARNKVIEMDEVPYSTEFEYKRQTGRSVGTRFGYIFEGFYQDITEIANSPINTFGNAQPGDVKFKDRNNDGVINDMDLGAIGYGKIPEFTGGLTVGISYKGFSFSTLWQGTLHSTIQLSGNNIKEFDLNGDNLKAIHLERWAYYTNPLTGEVIDTRATATFHRLSTGSSHFNNYISSLNVISGDYLRLKNIELSYDVPTKITNKVYLAKMLIFMRGNNILLFDHLKKYGIDPETADNSFGTYPQSKTYTIGLNVTF